MKAIEINGKTFVTMITKRQIAKATKRLAKEIEADYKYRKPPVFIVITNGSIMFASDLIRKIKMDTEYYCLSASSYKQRLWSSVITVADLDVNLVNRDVIIVEDIVDTGKTINRIIDLVKKQLPSSIEVVTLLKKKVQEEEVNVKYVGFNIDHNFVVGYGMDYQYKCRNLTEIYDLLDEKE